ncbi:hypothetical protein [Streptomyces klenkii]
MFDTPAAHQIPLPDEGRVPCRLFADHPGGHGFDFGTEQHEEIRHPQLTVGDVRRAWKELADDTPIRVAAAGPGVLTAAPAEALLKATGEGWSAARDIDGRQSGVRIAAVLMIGHGPHRHL